MLWRNCKWKSSMTCFSYRFHLLELLSMRLPRLCCSSSRALVFVVRVDQLPVAMDRERSPRPSPKDHVAQSQMNWMQQARPAIMQPNHVQWSPNPALMRPFGGLCGQSQAPPPPAHAQQHTAVVPYVPHAAAAGNVAWKRIRTANAHGSTSGTRTVQSARWPYRTVCNDDRWKHGKGSGQQTPMARPQVPGQFSQHVGPIVPSEFQQNPQFLDSRRFSGLRVKCTDWSHKKQIVGCPVHFTKGFHSYWLRQIAEGKPAYLAGFKSLSEVVFCHAFFAQLREEGLDLDGLAASALQQTGQTCCRRTELPLRANWPRRLLVSWCPCNRKLL